MAERQSHAQIGARVPDDPSFPSNRNAVLAIVLISAVMIVLDISIVITGLPKIHQELGFTDAGLSWVSNAYTLTFGGFLLLGARAGDILGRRLMFVSGLSIFAAASLAIGFAPSPAWLIAARAVQGLGSAILAPSTLALLQTSFPTGPERMRAISYYAAAGGVSASIGLVVGGLLADGLSWRVGFFINLPIGAALIFAALRVITESDRRTGKFDLAGALTSTLGMGTLVFGIVETAERDWTNSVTVTALVAGLVLISVFVLTEARAAQPIMPLRLFADVERSGAYVSRMAFIGANVGFFFFSTQFMQGVLGYGPAAAGVAFLPSMIVNFAAALLAPRAILRFGNKPVLLASLIAGLLGMAMLSRATADTSYWYGLALPMLLIGFGQGGALGPLTTAGIAKVKTEDAGAASGLINAAHQLGGALGLGVQIAASVVGAGMLTGTPLLAHRVGNAMIAAAALVFIAIVVTAFTASRKGGRRHPEEGTKA